MAQIHLPKRQINVQINLPKRQINVPLVQIPGPKGLTASFAVLRYFAFGYSPPAA